MKRKIFSGFCAAHFASAGKVSEAGTPKCLGG